MPHRILLALVTLLLISVPTRAGDPVTVSAAISLKPALEAMRADYERDSGDRLIINYGASGALLAQIKAGAPVDLFIAAANKQMDDLMSADLGDRATRTEVARGRLVLIVPAGSSVPIARFSDLAAEPVRRVAIGQPKTVPAGDYASQALANAKLSDAVSTKLLLGANVRQVLDYVLRGEVDAGLVYATDARDAADAVRVVETIDAGLHEPIVYPAAVVANAPQPAAARRFLQHLQGDAARQILTGKGFDLPPTASPAAGPTTAPVTAPAPMGGR